MTPFVVASRWHQGEPGGAPVAVAGLLRSSIGIGAGARIFLDALHEAGVESCELDVGHWTSTPCELAAPTQPRACSTVRTIVTHLNPPELELALRASRARIIEGRRHIGYWAWELPKAPESWRRAFRYVDEVWTPSHFSAKALRAIAPPGKIVRVVPHPVCAQAAARPDRRGFGLPDDACLTFAALDLKSTAARKNPEGVLEAYLRAVPHPSTASMLVCKINGAAAAPSLFQAIQARIRVRPDIRLVDEVLSEERMGALTASVDIILSPHRAEGFGLVLAQAMRLGKAVVATGWSGNIDFMDEECSALIRYTLIPVRDRQGMYGGSQWADPDIEHAAELLAGLIGDPKARKALGRRAADRIARQFDTNAWARAVKASLTAPAVAAAGPPLVT